MPEVNLGSCVIAFDFGLARIGVAQGNTLLGIAHPIQTILAQNDDTRFAQIQKIISEWQPATLIVGLPSHMDGKEHEMTARCRRFARQLNGRFDLPVFMVDERLTSIIAEQLLKEAQVKTKKHKAVLDQVAAQAILYSYFENRDNDSFVVAVG